MKIVKIGLALIVLIGIVGGVGYGLARVGIGPLAKLLKKGKPAAIAGTPGAPHGPGVVGAATSNPPPDDPLASEKRVLAAQRKAFDEERAAWQSQVSAAQAAKARSDVGASLDPKSLTRLAAVYESMPTDAVTRIFTKLPDGQILGLLRLMEEKRVGEILASVAPDRAARLTLSLSRPVVVANPPN